MDNASGNNYSRSILDKFRSISEANQGTASLNPDKTSSVSNGQTGSVKRKESGTAEQIESAAGLSEQDVGITQYISSLSGFSGIIKHRFSDFQVNEIDAEGNVVQLTSFDIPQDPVLEGPDFDLVLPEDKWKSIDEILSSTEAKLDPLLIDVTDKSKDERTSIHTAIRRKYGSAIISNTKEVDDNKFIEIKKKTKHEGRGDWPKARGSFLHCTMFKINKDTTELIHLLAERLRMKNNNIGFAGTKDKRAKTSQRISFKKRSAESVLRFKTYNVLFGNFCYKSSELRLGENRGNRFRIAIRNVDVPDEDVEANMISLREHGFINYFGLQRFGNYSIVPTYAIGKALLASDWKLAIELILKPKPNSKRRKELLLAQQSWYKDRDAVAAVKWLPRYDNTLEAKILRTLKALGNNAFLNALMALPRNTMTLYLHSYQSLIWNRIVSRRIEKFGLKPLPGDLLFVEETNTVEEEDKQDTDEEEQDTTSQSSSADRQNTPNTEEKRLKIKKRIKVREVSENEVETACFGDIVYPLPGNDIQYPNNEIKSWYEEVLAQDNFTLDNFNNTDKHFALSGSYRRLLSKAEDMTWNIVRTDSLDQDLILSDYDKIKNIQLPDTNPDGEFRSVIVEFNLESCCYATMALREVMKCDTSVHHQSQLTEHLVSTGQSNSKKMKAS